MDLVSEMVENNIFTPEEAIQACKEVEESDVFGENVKRVLRNTRKSLEEAQSGVPQSFEIKGFEILEKTAKAQGTSGRVYVPPDWIGHRVAIVRLD